MEDPLILKLILPNHASDYHLLYLAGLGDLLLSGHLRHFVHDGDVGIVALNFLIILRNISDNVFDFQVFSGVGAAELGSLVVLLKLEKVGLDVVLRLGDMKVFVFAEDCIIEGEFKVFPLFRWYLFVLIVDVVGIGKHGEIVKIADNRTDQIYLTIYQ